MPAGDYTNCNKCGKPIFGYGLCIACSKSSYNVGSSYDFYGNQNSTVLPPNPNTGENTLATILNTKLKNDAKKHVQLLAKMMGEPTVSESEFEEFWENYMKKKAPNTKKETLNDIYNDVIEQPTYTTNVPPTVKSSNISSEDSIDELYYKMIDQVEQAQPNCRCDDCEYDNNEDITNDELDNILKQSNKSFNDVFENFFKVKDEPKAKTPVAAPVKSNTDTDIDMSLEDQFDSLFGLPLSNPTPAPVKALKKPTLVVNLFAGPGSGKSTTAAGIFFELKTHGINCELATEFVKDLVWEERHKAIDNQIYVFAKQHHRITRLIGEVDVIITDSPLLLTLVYDKDYEYSLKALAEREHSRLWTFNCFIKRNKEFNPKGRMQNYDEARKLDHQISNMLDCKMIPDEVYFGNSEGKDKIVNKILQILGHKQ